MLAGFVVPSDLDPLEVSGATAFPNIIENATAANTRNLFEGLCHNLDFAADQMKAEPKDKQCAYPLDHAINNSVFVESHNQLVCSKGKRYFA